MFESDTNISRQKAQMVRVLEKGENRMERLDEPGFTRINHACRIFDIPRATWYKAVSEGKIKKPLKLGQKAAAYSNDYINHLISKVENGNPIL